MNLFDFLKPKIIVVTHDSGFHADDVFAVATLSIWAEENGKRIKVVRTRDQNKISKADMVVDVGMQHDSERNRFDHHQRGGAGNHAGTDPSKVEAGIPYASFGLVWKHYGEKICDKECSQMIERRLIIPIDAKDNGINIYNIKFPDVYEYSAGDAIHTLRKAADKKGKDLDKAFMESVHLAKEIIKGEITIAKSYIEGEKETLKAIDDQGQPEILLLDRYVEWEDAVSKFNNIKFVVYPERTGSGWRAETARDDIENYNSDRGAFPKNWRGVRDQDLAQMSGIRDAVFCTNGGWLAGAKSKEGAIEMVKMALQNSR